MNIDALILLGFIVLGSLSWGCYVLVREWEIEHGYDDIERRLLDKRKRDKEEATP